MAVELFVCSVPVVELDMDLENVTKYLYSINLLPEIH
jgi:hypothetical protein